jgi:phosphoribosylformylglycinamidine synthase
MVGRLPDAARAGRVGFAREGDAIAVVGAFAPTLAGSELAKLRGEAPAGPLPPMDEQAVRDAHEAVREAVRAEALHNAHDIAEGGFAVALAECCLAGGIGATVRLPGGLDPFAEAPGRAFIVSGDEQALRRFQIIGRVGGAELEIAGVLRVGVAELRHARERGLAERVYGHC